MSDLFDELGRFTPEGMSLLKEVSESIKPIFFKYKEKGFKAREIGHAAAFAIHDAENIMCLQEMHKKFKEKKNESHT